MRVASSGVQRRSKRLSRRSSWHASKLLAASCLGLLVSGGFSAVGGLTGLCTPVTTSSASRVDKTSSAITINRVELVADDADVLQVKLYTQGGRVQYRTQLEDQGMVIRLPNARLSPSQVESGYPVVLDASHRYIGRALPDPKTGGVKVVLPNVSTDSVLVSVSQFVTDADRPAPVIAHQADAAPSSGASRVTSQVSSRKTSPQDVGLNVPAVQTSLKPPVLPESMQAAEPTESTFEADPLAETSAVETSELDQDNVLSSDSRRFDTSQQDAAAAPSSTWIQESGLGDVLSTLDFYGEVTLLKQLLQWSALLVVFLGVGLLGGLMVFTVLGWMIQNLMPERLIETARQQNWSPENWSREDMLVPGVFAASASPFPALHPESHTTRDDADVKRSPSMHHGGQHGRQTAMAHQAEAARETLSDVRESKAVLKSLAKKLRDVRFNSESTV